MRAINKDDVINMIKSCITVPVDNQWDSGYNTAMAEIKKQDEQMPTVNAEEAKPVNSEKSNPESEQYCYDCIHNEVCRYCPRNGCDFKEISEPVKQWHSVEENQPDSVGDDVLVVDKSGKYHIAYYLSGSENWMNQDTREPIKNVVKWRYLDGDGE